MKPGVTKLFLLPALLAVGALSAGNAIAGPKGEAKTVQALGQAAIFGGDKSNARDKAIADAQRKSVEMAVGAMVSSETVTENFELLSDKIFSKSSGYVRSYKIVSEKEDAGVYVVKIEAVVSAGDLQNDLDGILAVLRAKNMPRVLLMITEQNVGSDKTATWWAGESSFSIDLGVVENTFIDAWSSKGFTFVDRKALQGQLKSGNALSGAGQPSDDAIKAFAADTGAEVVVIGKAIANDAGSIMGTQLHSVRANISIRALNLDNGEIIGTATNSGSAGHIDPITGGTKALKAVATKASDELLKKILAKWSGHVAGPQNIQVTLKNVPKMKTVRKLMAFIRDEVRGVQNVRQRSFRKKVVQLEVSIKGNAQNLAEELEEKKFGGYSVEIDEMTANTITGTMTK